MSSSPTNPENRKNPRHEYLGGAALNESYNSLRLAYHAGVPKAMELNTSGTAKRELLRESHLVCFPVSERNKIYLESNFMFVIECSNLDLF